MYERSAHGSAIHPTQKPLGITRTAWAWCDHCGWRADHHPDDPPIGRAVTRIVNTTTTTKETTP